MSITLRVLAFALLIATTVLLAASLKIESSSAQNSNSSTTTNKNQSDARPIAPAPAKAPEQDFSKNTWELPEDADKTKNPTPATAESIEKGRALYYERTKANCIFCHGETGSGNMENLPKLRRKPADLSNKERMMSLTDGEIFWKLSKGITGIMPAGEERMTEEERWHVVNYVRTLASDEE